MKRLNLKNKELTQLNLFILILKKHTKKMDKKN